MLIYADNAATTKLSKNALQAMMPYLEGEYGNPSSLHTVGQRAAEAVIRAREDIAGCIGCQPSEITFTSGGSEADNQAIISAAILGEKKGHRHIVSTAFEHHAVLHTLKMLEKRGFEITLVGVNSDGVVSADDIASAIREDTCLVTVMYANNEIGTVQPIAEIGSICRQKGVIFHTDAVQAVGHVPINVADQNIDMLSISAHKFHGPKGVGVLYCRKGIPLTSLINGGAQERGKRAGTENVAAIVGTAAALKESLDGLQQKSEMITAMRDRLITELSKIPHSVLNGSAVNRLPGNVNMCFEGIEGESLLLLLDMNGICASSGSACTSGSLDPSHVLLAIGRSHETAHGSLRLSLSEYNTMEEIEYIIKVVPQVVKQLRDMSPLWKDMEEGKKQHVI